MENTEYDFILVGGGTSGLVTATRLSEDPNIKVLVLEAGSNHVEDPRVAIPALWRSMIGPDSDVSWNFTTVPQKELNGRCIPYPQGRMLGGSSAINGEALIAQSKAGVDAWTQLGNSGWDWETLAPYYAKSQTITLPDERLREHLGIDYSYDAATGTSGPIQASFSDLIDEPLTKAWIDTFKTLNAKATGDPFSGQTVGGFSNPSTIDPKTKTRSYAATAYYLPAKDRPNLFLKTGATVEKVLLDDSNGNITATGVQYVKDGNTETAVARKEVILSASAILTPKLLELSGIGNPDILKAQSIPVVVENRNVGENLQDHVMGGISFEVKEGVQTVDELARGNPEAIGAAMQAYQTTQSGAFAMGGVNSNAFMPLADCLNPDERANPQNLLDQHLDNHPSSTSHHQHSLIRSILSNPHEGSAGLLMYPCQTNFHNPPSAQHNGRPSATSYLENLQSGNFFTLGAVLLHPFSRGSVHIGSADPNAAPVLDPKYLSHPLDIEILARYTQFLETLAATEPLASYIRPNGRRNARAAEANIATDVAATKEYLRDSICSIWHPVGTCAMMPREAGGVVDERLRVYGTKGLRVVDASVFPLVTRGNPVATVYAVAERAADIIKEDHGLKGL